MSRGAQSSAAERHEREPLDYNHLKSYALSDPGLELEILRLFVAQVPLTIETLKYASLDKDWQIAAHTLKGAARAVGAWLLAELAEEAERLGGIDDRAACDKLVVCIEKAASETERYISNHCRT